MAQDNDPGARFCGHEHRVHSIGAGIFVCFTCWLRVLFGDPRVK